MMSDLQMELQLGAEQVAGLVFGGNLLTRDALRMRAADEEWECLSFGRRERVSIPAPDDPELPSAFRSITGARTVDRPFVCELPNAVLAGPQPLVRTDDGRVVLESADADRGVFEHRAVELIRKFGADGFRFLGGLDISLSRRYEHVFPLVRHPTTNYYHWLLTDLIKIRALRAYCEKTDDLPTILIDGDPPRWVIESLDRLGIDPEQCEPWPGGFAVAERVVLPYHRQTMDVLETGPDDCQWLRTAVLDTLNPSPTRENRRLFVSRADADCRRIVNRDEVRALLSEYGFETHRLTDHSFGEQARLFAEAEAVVGAHGAGLVNTLFGTDLSVLELLPSDEVRTMYFQLAGELGHTYEYILCESRGSDIVVDTRVLRKRLRNLLGSG